MTYFENIEQTGLLIDFLDFDIVTVSSSSYDEDAIRQTIEQSGKEKQLLAAAIQLATVGWGKGNYGVVKVDGGDLSLEDLFVQANVYYGNDEGAALDPGDLTPKRLCRFYRFHITQWLKEKKLQSYLVRKYGSRLSRKFYFVIFPGAEYFVTSDDHCKALVDCYASLDSRCHTNFVPRILSIYKSRGLGFAEEE
jgi:hypothetical protein